MADKATSSISINADKAAVMAVIADFEAYPDWASMIRTATVDEREHLAVHDAAPGGQPLRVAGTEASRRAERIGVSQMHVSRILANTLRCLRDQLE